MTPVTGFIVATATSGLAAYFGAGEGSQAAAGLIGIAIVLLIQECIP